MYYLQFTYSSLNLMLNEFMKSVLQLPDFKVRYLIYLYKFQNFKIPTPVRPLQNQLFCYF